MEIATLGIYSQKVTIFVLHIVADKSSPRNTNLLRRQTPRNAVSAERFWAPFFEKVRKEKTIKQKFLHALLFSKSGQIKKVWHRFFLKATNKKVRKNLKWVAYAEV